MRDHISLHPPASLYVTHVSVPAARGTSAPEKLGLPVRTSELSIPPVPFLVCFFRDILMTVIVVVRDTWHTRYKRALGILGTLVSGST